MSTIKIRPVEGRRVRDHNHPTRAVVERGAVLEVSEFDATWSRRLRDGDVELVNDAQATPAANASPRAAKSVEKE